MMTKQQALTEQFTRAVANLREVLEKFKNQQTDKAVYRDSAIQRFEIAFDLSWKALREKLRAEFGVDATSPKKAFQEGFKQGILANDPLWLDLIETRNLTTHAYSEAFAEKTVLQLPQALVIFEKLLWKLTN